MFTCGQDGCFKSWILDKNKQTSSSNPNQDTYNWIYNTCNGYRDLVPNNVEFFSLNNNDLISVSFNHIITLWKYDIDGSISFIDDLIHCDLTDKIKSIKLIDKSNLLVVHQNCLNVWNFKYTSSNDSADLLAGLNDTLISDCIWNTQFQGVLNVESNPAKQNQLLLFTRDQLNSSNDVSTKITGK